MTTIQTPFRLIAVSPTSQSAPVGGVVASPPAVMLTDVEGFPCVGWLVGFSVTAGGGTVSPDGVVTDSAGIASTSSWVLGAGTNGVLAYVGGLSVAFSATGTAPVAAAIAAVSLTSQQGVVGAAVSSIPTVRVVTATGVPVAGVAVGWSVVSGGGSFPEPMLGPALTDAAGLSSPPGWILGPTPGTNTMRATVAGLTGSPVTFTCIAVSAGPTTLLAASALSQSAQVNTNVSSPPRVRVVDAQGLPVQNISVSFVVVSGGGSISPATVLTNSSGYASATSWTLGGSLGSNSALASVPGLSGSPISFEATGTAAPPGPGTTPTQVAANSSVSQTAQVGTKVAASPSVIVKDAGNAGCPGVLVSFTIVSGAGQLSAATALTDASGIATLGYWVLGVTPGTDNNVLHASVAGLTGSPVIFTATATPGTGQLNVTAYQDVCYVALVEKFYASGGAQTVGGTGNVVRVFDAKTRTHLHDIVVGNVASGMVYANGKVYVAMNAGNIAVIDVATDTVLTTITIAGTWKAGVYVPTTDRVVFVQSTSGAVTQINPNTDTASTLIGSHATYGHIAYAESSDRLYIPSSGAGVGVFNPSTGALITTITGLSNGPCVYADAPPTVYATAAASGGNLRLAAINPATNTIRGYVTISTATYGVTQITDLGYSPDTALVYALGRIPTGTALIFTINPATDGIERADWANPSATSLGGYDPVHQSFWTWGLYASYAELALWNTATHGPMIRSRITESHLAAPQMIVTEARPLGPGDLVTFRRNAEGSYRVRLEWPEAIAALGIQREMLLSDDTVRGERNYAINPWGRDWKDGYVAPGWALSSTRESRWYARDVSAWLSTVAQADGAIPQSPLTALTIQLKGLTPGDVLEPGDVVVTSSTLGGQVASRGVVNGEGKVSVLVTHWPTSTADGANLTIKRPPVPDWLVPGQGIVLCGGQFADAVFSVPYYAGLTTLWCTMEGQLWLWRNAEVQMTPATAISFQTIVGSSILSTLTPTDTTPYDDATVLQGPYLLSYRHTMVPGDVIRLRVTLNAGSLTPGGNIFTNVALYLKRVQATLGPEADIAPPFEFNADHGALFHAGQRALRDRGQAPVQYVCAAEETDAEPFTIGATVDLRHRAVGIHATPRLLSVTRSVSPGSESVERPEIRLDNLPPSLSRRLSSTGER